MRTSRIAPLVTLVLAACSSEEGTAVVGEAPQVLSKADGGDRADRACQVVLGRVARPAGPTGGFASSSGWYAWEGEVRVAPDALGAEPRVLYGVFGQWYSTAAVPTGERDGGMLTYRFRIDEHTVREGTSTTSLSRFRMSVIPYLATAGGRLFDHNRLPGDFEVYELDQANAWAIAADPGVCRFDDTRRTGTLVFDAAYRTEQRGALVPGGDLRIEYAPERLTQCRGTHNGFPAWDIQAIVRFAPGGEQREGTVRAFETVTGVPTTRAYAFPFVTAVPRGAQRVEVWFRNTGIGCEAWDSAFGANYRFEVIAPPAAPLWAGELGSCFNRDCVRHDGAPSDVRVDSYLMQRACMFVEADVYVPGLTDGVAVRPELVLAKAVWKADGGAEASARVEFQGRVGNNYRYRWVVDRDWMNRNAWSTIEWQLRFSTDASTWLPAEGGWRTLTRSF